MKIGIPAETKPGETRVAATPETIKKYLAAKHQVVVQSGAGVASSITDEAYILAGAQIVSAAEAFGSELVLKVRAPDSAERSLMKSGSVLVGMLNPFDAENTAAMAAAGIQAFALEAAPRITRAQSMDVLSSQANIAGYKAVMVAANTYARFMPMLMTAAGTVKAARVLIMGVGVAGLQAIATAKRLGAVIEASDVRPPVKEQVERAKLADIIITTALIPGRKAPVLISEETVKAMKPGSVIVDMAVEQGGNCPLSELGKTVTKYGVHIIGEPNLATLVAADASALYARNVLDFLKLIINKEAALEINREDEIVAATLLCSEGAVLRK